MKITCDVIKDILPLYAEGLASPDTAALAEEHLAACEACRNALNELRAPVSIAADTDAAPLRRVRRTMKRQKARTIVFTALVCLAIAVTALGWLTSHEYIPYAGNIISVTEHDGGLVFARFGEGVSGYEIISEPMETGEGTIVHTTAWDSVWNRLFNSSIPGGEIVLNPNGGTVTAVYYDQADEAESVLLHGKGIYDSSIILPRLFLAYYAVFAAVLASVCIVMTALLRRRKAARRIVWRIALAPLSYLIAHVLIKGFSTVTYSGFRDLFLILLTAIPVYGALFIVSARIKRRGFTKKRAEP